MIYLDYNATTPCAPEVIEAMRPFWAIDFGNPSSSHKAGFAAKKAVENGRKQISELANCSPSELFFTSGATESNNLIFLGLLLSNKTVRDEIIISSIEHKSVSEPAKFLSERGFNLIKLPVSKDGVVDLEKAEKLITNNTALVSVQAANNEIGTIQPIAEIASLAHRAGSLFHTDLLLNVWPYVAVFLTRGAAQWLYGGTALLLWALNWRVAAWMRVPRRVAWAFPLSVLLFVAIQWRAMYLTLRNRGIRWRDTHYPLDELKANRV
jgi:hypothetical protein